MKLFYLDIILLIILHLFGVKSLILCFPNEKSGWRYQQFLLQDTLVVQRLGLYIHCKGHRFNSLVEDLRSCMTCGVAKRKKSIPSSKLSKDIHSSTFLQNYLFPLKNFITHCHLASASSTEVNHDLCIAKPKGHFGNSISK